MAQIFLNNCYATLAQAITATDTQIELSGMNGFPASLGAGDFFLLTLYADTTRYGENIEVVKVTGLVASTLTVERGFEGTAVSHDAVDKVEARLTANTLHRIDKPPLTIGTQAPTDAEPGAEWIDSSSMQHFVYYDDGTSVQWVEVLGAEGPQGVEGPIGPEGPQGIPGSWNDLLDKPASFPAQSHGHDASEITSGVLTRPVNSPTYKLSHVATTGVLNLATSNFFVVDSSVNRTLSFSNTPSGTEVMSVAVKLNGNGGTVTWPTSISWSGNNEPELKISWTLVLLLWDGSSWAGFVSGGAD